MDPVNHIEDLLPAYAMGSLDLEERRRVEQHLMTCLSCQEELKVYQSVVDNLALAVPVKNPPSRLKQNLLRAVTSPARPTPSFMQRLSGGRIAVPAWGLVGAAILLLLLVVGNLLLWQQAQRVNTPPGFQVVQLHPTANAAQAIGWIVISRDGQDGTLIVEGLPALGPKYQYQLWLGDPSQRVSGALFSVKEGGYASIWVESPHPLIDFHQFGITIEPIGGSPGPTGPKVLGGNAR